MEPTARGEGHSVSAFLEFPRFFLVVQNMFSLLGQDEQDKQRRVKWQGHWTRFDHGSNPARCGRRKRASLPHTLKPIFERDESDEKPSFKGGPFSASGHGECKAVVL